MDKLLELLFGMPWWLVLGLAVYGACLGLFTGLYSHELARKRWIGFLIRNTWSRRYRDLLGNMLDWIDARLTPEIAEKGWKPDEARSAWSYGLLKLSLLLAVAYPILSVLVHWGVTNTDGRIGALVLVEGAQPLWSQLTVIGCMALAFGCGLHAKRAEGVKRRGLEIATLGLLVAPIYASEGSAILVVAFAVGLTLIAEGDGDKAIAFSLGIAVAAAIAPGVSLPLVVAIALAGVAGIAQDWIAHKIRQPVLTLLVFILLTEAALIVTIKYKESTGSTGEIVIVFLGILPALNALADFVSTGLTRWRLRKGLAGHMLREMSIDLAGAAAIFFLLGAASILAIDWMRWSDGTPLFDLPGFFDDLRRNPNDYWWLYFTLFSTLIPTLLHGSVAFFGSFIHFWPGLRRFIANGLDAGGRGDVVAGRLAVQALCLAMTVAVVAPVFVLGHFAVYRGIVGHALLDLFEGFAHLVGAI